MTEFKLEVTTPDDTLRYRTFRDDAKQITGVLREELALDPEPGTRLTVEVLG